MNIKYVLIGITLFTASLMSMSGNVFAVTGTPGADTVRVETGVAVEKGQEAQPSEVSNPALRSTYALPYPGILPDHPLYFLKTLRDKIIESLIADPVRKAEFYILQADKSINTAIFLQQKGKIALSTKAIDQTVAFSKLASDTLVKIKNSGSGGEISGVLDRFSRSQMKHREVLSDYAAKATDSLKESSEKALKAMETLGIEGK